MFQRIAIALAVAAGLMTAPAALHPEAVSYVVSPGDVLEITYYAGGEKQEAFTVTVSADGTITCPLIGEFSLGGMPISEIVARLQGILARDYYIGPQVLVSVKEYGGRVYVLGEVKHPGVYALPEAPTALSACVNAGGFTDFAAPRHAKVTRIQDGKPKLFEVDLVKVKQGKAEDLPLLGGDRIDVPRRRF